MSSPIPFNIPPLTGDELPGLTEVLEGKQLSGNGRFTRQCHAYFEDQLKSRKTLLTTSCTDALEMAALLLRLKPGDEVIIPAYTFVSTALAFFRQGATIVFADSRPDHPGIDEGSIRKLITPRTKAIVVVHYAGIACDMDRIMQIAADSGLYVVEDAAQAVGAAYCGQDGKKRPLGSIGHLATFSFHDTKNIQCGEGGLLVVNDDKFVARSEILWEKGTNRSAFYRGEVSAYEWVDTGSSFLPSELNAAFLFAQLQSLKKYKSGVSTCGGPMSGAFSRCAGGWGRDCAKCRTTPYITRIFTTSSRRIARNGIDSSSI